jgi:membrane protein YqaA with SNARE-associated domain
METAPGAVPAKKPWFGRRLYDWTLTWADSRYGVPALFCLAFTESSFFPIPPDVLLSALCFSKPQRWVRYVVYCSVGSVLGGVFGWWIGREFWDLSGDFFFHHVPGFTPEVFAIVQAKYQQNAFLAVLTAAFTPIPYKVFTIASGVFHVPLATVVWASVVGRSARFLLLALAIRVAGARIRPHLERNFEIAVLLLALLAALGFLAIKWLQ